MFYFVSIFCTTRTIGRGPFSYFVLNSSKDLILLISGGEIAHIFGLKEDIVSNT